MFLFVVSRDNGCLSNDMFFSARKSVFLGNELRSDYELCLETQNLLHFHHDASRSQKQMQIGAVVPVFWEGATSIWAEVKRSNKGRVQSNFKRLSEVLRGLMEAVLIY